MFGFYIRVCIRNLYAIHQDTKSTWYLWWHKNVWIFISTNIMLTNTNNNQLWPHNKRQWFNTTTTRLTITLSHMRTTHWRAAGRIAQGYPQRTPHFVVILIWTNPHTITYRYFYKSRCRLVSCRSKRRTLCFPRATKTVSSYPESTGFDVEFSRTNVGSVGCVFLIFLYSQFFNSWRYKINQYKYRVNTILIRRSKQSFAVKTQRGNSLISGLGLQWQWG